MKMLISCVVLLCVADAINGLNPGNPCDANTPCDDAKLVCQGAKCKFKAGQNCSASTNNCLADASCNAQMCTCGEKYTSNSDKTKCELKIGQGCSVTNDCLTGTTCTGTPKNCTCPEGNTPNDDNTKCGAINGLAPGADCNAKTHCADDKLVCQGDKCKLKIGQDCTDNNNDCVTSATCTGNTKKKCTCPEGKTPNDDKTKCAAASASAVASVLLMVAAFLSSRWM